METSKSDTKQGKLKSDKVKMELTHFLRKEKLSFPLRSFIYSAAEEVGLKSTKAESLGVCVCLRASLCVTDW